MFLLVPALVAQGQGLMDRKRPDLIPLEGQARRIGWFIGPGITWTLGRDRSEEEMFRSADTVYSAAYDPAGRVGPYLEAGLSWYTRDPVIVDYLDVGLAYKDLRGSEAFSGMLVRGDSVLPLEGEGVFAERMLTLSVNANRFIPTFGYQFLQLSLGANADYRLGGRSEHDGDPRLNDHRFPPDVWAQAHARVGYGFKLTGRLLLIPTVETPVFSVIPADGSRFGAMQWFSTDHRPFILSVRCLFLRPRKGFDCPPPIKHKGQMKHYKQDGYHP